jgi:hypothetical protein
MGTNPYPILVDSSIQHPWLQTSGEMLSIQIPSIESILGDKLAAFAPTTTGILYEKLRPVEMIKQLYDIGSLFDDAKDFRVVKESYLRNVSDEIKYRNLSISWKESLEDSFQAALTLSLRDENNVNYTQMQKGISNIVNFILGKFHLEEALVCAAKTAYLSKLLRQTEIEVRRYDGPVEIAAWTIQGKELIKLNKLKKTNPQAFFYWYQAWLYLV